MKSAAAMPVVETRTLISSYGREEFAAKAQKSMTAPDPTLKRGSMR